MELGERTINQYQLFIAIISLNKGHLTQNSITVSVIICRRDKMLDQQKYTQLKSLPGTTIDKETFSAICISNNIVIMNRQRRNRISSVLSCVKKEKIKWRRRCLWIVAVRTSSKSDAACGFLTCYVVVLPPARFVLVDWYFGAHGRYNSPQGAVYSLQVWCCSTTNLLLLLLLSILSAFYDVSFSRFFLSVTQISF